MTRQAEFQGIGPHCDYPLRVRYAETDQMGVAYYANYFVWFEVGRAELCRLRGFSYESMERETDSFLAVVEAHCRYRAPLRYDCQFIVRTRLKAFHKRAVAFSYQLLDPVTEKIYAEGETTHVITGRDGRPKLFPEQYKKFLLDEQ